MPPGWRAARSPPARLGVRSEAAVGRTSALRRRLGVVRPVLVLRAHRMDRRRCQHTGKCSGAAAGRGRRAGGRRPAPTRGSRSGTPRGPSACRPSRPTSAPTPAGCARTWSAPRTAAAAPPPAAARRSRPRARRAPREHGCRQHPARRDVDRLRLLGRGHVQDAGRDGRHRLRAQDAEDGVAHLGFEDHRPQVTGVHAAVAGG